MPHRVFPARADRRGFVLGGIAAAASIPRRVRAQGAAAPVRIGYQKFNTLNILKGSGALDGALARIGREVRWFEFQAGPQLLEAMNAGAIDLGRWRRSPTASAWVRRARPPTTSPTAWPGRSRPSTTSRPGARPGTSSPRSTRARPTISGSRPTSTTTPATTPPTSSSRSRPPCGRAGTRRRSCSTASAGSTPTRRGCARSSISAGGSRSAARSTSRARRKDGR